LYVRSGIAGLGPYGLWIATPAADYVIYAEDTSPLHRQHIILHELSHLLCDHHPAPLDDVSLPDDLFRDLRPETIVRLLQRAAYTTAEEREAEMLATLLLARLNRDAPDHISSSDPQATEVSRRLIRSLASDDPIDR